MEISPEGLESMSSGKEITVEVLEEKFRNNPSSLVFSRLADSYRKNGDIQKAIDICNEGLESHPDYSTGRIILGRCYLELENFGDAVSAFTEVCKRDRKNQMAIKMLADIYSKQGMEEKAGDLYSLLLSLDPENQSFVHLAGLFHGAGKSFLGEIIDIQDDASIPQSEEMAFDVESVDEDANFEEMTSSEEVSGSEGDEFAGILDADEMSEEKAPEVEEISEPNLDMDTSNELEDQASLPDMDFEEEIISEPLIEENVLDEISNDSIDLTEEPQSTDISLVPEDVNDEIDLQPDEELTANLDDSLDVEELSSDVENAQIDVDESGMTDISDEGVEDLAIDLEEIGEIPEELPDSTDGLVSRVDSLFGDEESTVSVPVSKSAGIEDFSETTDLSEDLSIGSTEDLQSDLSSRMGALFEEEESGGVEEENVKLEEIIELSEGDDVSSASTSDEEMIIEELTPSEDDIVLEDTIEMTLPVEDVFSEQDIEPTEALPSEESFQLPETSESEELELISDEVVQESQYTNETAANGLDIVTSADESSTIEENVILDDSIEIDSAVDEDNVIPLDEQSGDDLFKEIDELSGNELVTDKTSEMFLPSKEADEVEEVALDDTLADFSEEITDNQVSMNEGFEVSDSDLEIVAENADDLFVSKDTTDIDLINNIDMPIIEEGVDSIEIETAPVAIDEDNIVNEFSIDEVTENVQPSVEVSPEDVASRIDEIYTEEETSESKKESVVTGDDVMERIDELFPEEDSIDASSLETIPDDEPDELPVSEFYSENGNDASDEVEPEIERGFAEENEDESSSLIMEVDSPTEDFNLSTTSLSDSREPENIIEENELSDLDVSSEPDENAKLVFDMDSPTMEIEPAPLSEGLDDFSFDTNVTDDIVEESEDLSETPILMESDSPTESISLSSVLDNNKQDLETFESADLTFKDESITEEHNDNLIFDLDNPTVEISDSDIDKSEMGEAIVTFDAPLTTEDSTNLFELDEDVSSDEFILDDTLEEIDIPSSELSELKKEPEVLDVLDVTSSEAIKPKSSETQLIIPSETMDEIDASNFSENLEDMDAIPDEDEDEEPVSEFYTEEGDSAEAGDEISSEDESAEFIEDVHEEVELPEIDKYDEPIIFESVKDEARAEDETSEFIILDEKTDVFEDDILDEIDDSNVNDTLKELDELESNNNMMFDSLPDEEGDEAPLSEFYTETGDSAEENDILEEVESDTEGNGFDEELESIPQDENITVEESISNIETSFEPEDESKVKTSRSLEQEDFSKVENIPDHVLTPTLADIYFQQGQASLAVGIYKRLLVKNPENIKIEERIEEIEEYIRKSMEIEEDEPLNEASEEKNVPRKKSARKKTSTKKTTSKAGKPLKGVKIKKKIKERIQKVKTK